MKKLKGLSMDNNMLSDIYIQIMALPTRVRDIICKECGFTLPTIYRKIRTKDRIDQTGKVIQTLSNAEKGMIMKVVDQELETLWEYLDKYRKKNGR